MLEVIYNDCYSQLTLVNNINNESAVIIDDDFKVYQSLSYNPFQPSDEDFKSMWENAVNTYFMLGKDDNLKTYRENQAQQSINAFNEWLAKGGMY